MWILESYWFLQNDCLRVSKIRIKIELIDKTDGREGVDFLIGDNQLYLQPINKDAAQLSIKISKEDLGELRSDLFIVLVLIIDKEPTVFYFIPSEALAESNSDIFIENNVTLMPSLSNWEIKVTRHTIPALAKYSLENMIDKLNA